jgi:hypothetical protein
MRPSQQRSRCSDSLAIEAPRQAATIAQLGNPSRCNHYAREKFRGVRGFSRELCGIAPKKSATLSRAPHF